MKNSYIKCFLFFIVHNSFFNKILATKKNGAIHYIEPTVQDITFFFSDLQIYFYTIQMLKLCY